MPVRLPGFLSWGQPASSLALSRHIKSWKHKAILMTLYKTECLGPLFALHFSGLVLWLVTCSELNEVFVSFRKEKALSIGKTLRCE